VGDTTNWEFAAVVAAVTMGLGGLLLFTLFGIINSWRVFDRAGRAANEAAKASMAVQDLARYLASRETMHAVAPRVDLTQAADDMNALRQQADALIEQQDLGVDAGDHAHRQPDPHPGGVGAQRHRQVVTQFGELGDLIDLGQHLLSGLAEEQAADDDVLVAGDLWVHADPEIEDRRDPAGDRRRAAGGFVDARK